MEGQLGEVCVEEIPLVKDRSQRLVCMFYSRQDSPSEAGSGGKLAVEGVGPVCRAWHLGSEAEMPYCTCSFRQKCWWGRGEAWLTDSLPIPSLCLWGYLCFPASSHRIRQ